MAKTLHFDCFSGISGDMTLAALLDLGVPEQTIQDALASLELPGKLVVSRIKKSGMAATYIKVETPHEHKHRHLKHINEIIDKGRLTDGAKSIARAMFLKLAEAEAQVHGSTIEKVHFHEVGAVDSIFDFVGCAVGFDHLGIEQFTSRSVPTGSGTVQCEHGLMPIPAPATALLLQGVPLAEGDVSGELTTPTGAAILKTLVSRFGPAPAMTIEKIGVGAGTRELPDRPNVLRLLLGESEGVAPNSKRDSDSIWQLETNIDDAPAEAVGFTIERLFAAGALDVFMTPIQMKKLRPGVLITVLCADGDRAKMEAILFEETGTLGVRRSKRERSKLPRREESVQTRWGTVAGKSAFDGVRWRFAPEYDACAAVARDHKVPLRDVYQAAQSAFAPAQPNAPPEPSLMPGYQIAIITAYSIIIVIALLRHLILNRSLRATVFLEPNAAAKPSGFVSILIPAKDEEKTIERCLRSLMAQEGVNFEIIVVDDRSTDQTPQIVRRLAEQDPRLKLVQISELPPGWTGKCNALMQAQKQANGVWLLFVDADTIHHPRSIATALEYATSKKVDLFSLLPALEAASFWEGVVQPFAASCLIVLYPLARVNDPADKAHAFANGQFILIRRSAYDQIGGHESVRDKFLEDVNMARQVRNAGMTLNVAVAPELFATRMYASLASIIKGWSRIFYSGLDHRLSQLAMLTALIVVFSVTAYSAVVGAGLLWLFGYGCPFTKTIFFLGLVHVVIQMTVFYRMYRLTKSSMWYLPLRFLAVGVMLWIIAKTVVLCFTHRVEWRGTSYGKELKIASPLSNESRTDA